MIQPNFWLADRWSSRRAATLGHRAAWSGRGSGGGPVPAVCSFFRPFFFFREWKIWMLVEIDYRYIWIDILGDIVGYIVFFNAEIRVAKKQGAKRRIGLSNVQTCHGGQAVGMSAVCASMACQFYPSYTTAGFCVVPRRRSFAKKTGTWNCNFWMQWRCEIQIKTMRFFFLRGVSYQLLGADLDTTRTQTASDMRFFILISGNSGPCCREWPWRTRVSRSAETALSVNFTSQGFCL